MAAIPSATRPAPEAAVESSRSVTAGAGDLAPPRRQHLDLHGDLPRLDALVAALRAACADVDEYDGTALGLGAVEHAQLGADRIGEHRPGDEASLLKVEPGTTRPPSGLKKLQASLRSRWSAASGPPPGRRRAAFTTPSSRRSQNWHIPNGSGGMEMFGWPSRLVQRVPMPRRAPPAAAIDSSLRVEATQDSSDLSFVGTGTRPGAGVPDRPVRNTLICRGLRYRYMG